MELRRILAGLQAILPHRNEWVLREGPHQLMGVIQEVEVFVSCCCRRM